MSTQPRDENWGATWIKSSDSGLETRDERPSVPIVLTKQRPSIRKVCTNFADQRLSVGIVRSHTKNHGIMAD
jgi:hypothetical protein